MEWTRDLDGSHIKELMAPKGFASQGRHKAASSESWLIGYDGFIEMFHIRPITVKISGNLALHPGVYGGTLSLRCTHLSILCLSGNSFAHLSLHGPSPNKRAFRRRSSTT